MRIPRRKAPTDLTKPSSAYLTCFDVRSVCEDGLHAVFLDYDYPPTELLQGLWKPPIDADLRAEISRLIERRHLSDFFVTKTGNGFHAICPTKVGLGELIEIITECKHADQNMLKPLQTWKEPSIGARFDGEKGVPKLCMVIESKYQNERKQSYAHLKYMNIAWNIDLSKYTNTDGLKQLKTTKYQTKKK
jgi:hypothetical protein